MAKTVLAVDDEKSIVRLVQINLQRAGYNVVTASDGKQALDMIEAEPPDMVISDVMMPFMDGFELLKRLKQNPVTRELPIIMLTAKAMDSDVYEGWRAGADFYLTKPFNPQELLMWVRRIFEGRETPDDKRFEL